MAISISLFVHYSKNEINVGLNIIILIFQHSENDTYLSNTKLYLLSENCLHPQQHL